MANQRVASRRTCDFLGADVIEAYVMGRLCHDEREVQAIEEHLLWCESCQVRVEAEDKQLSVMRAALAVFATRMSKPLKSMAAGK